MEQREREAEHALELLLHGVEQRALLVRHLLVDVVLAEGEDRHERSAGDVRALVGNDVIGRGGLAHAESRF